METYCTITNFKELNKAEYLVQSVRQFHPDAHFSIFVSEKRKVDKPVIHTNNCSYYFFSEKYLPYRAEEMYKKYKLSKKFRFAMVPVFLQMLVEAGVQKAIYLDQNMECTNPINDLFAQLDRHATMLIPNGWPSNPHQFPQGFRNIFHRGFYNAGFLGVTSLSVKALDWWSEMVLFQFNKSRRGYLYDYQNYLNIFPYLFDGVYINKDKSIGIGAANIEERTSLIENEKASLIHYSTELINLINEGSNTLLKEKLNNYLQKLKKIEVSTFS